MEEKEKGLIPTFFWKTQILESHLDCFGHVNNATYLQLFEAARWDFITAGGFGLKEIMAAQKGPVILEATVKFKRELKNRDWIEISSAISGRPGEKICHIHQVIVCMSDGKVASTAQFTAGFFDLKERKLIAPTEKWIKAMGQIST